MNILNSILLPYNLWPLKSCSKSHSGYKLSGSGVGFTPVHVIGFHFSPIRAGGPLHVANCVSGRGLFSLGCLIRARGKFLSEIGARLIRPPLPRSLTYFDLSGVWEVFRSSLHVCDRSAFALGWQYYPAWSFIGLHTLNCPLWLGNSCVSGPNSHALLVLHYKSYPGHLEPFPSFKLKFLLLLCSQLVSLVNNFILDSSFSFSVWSFSSSIEHNFPLRPSN